MILRRFFFFSEVLEWYQSRDGHGQHLKKALAKAGLVFGDGPIIGSRRHFARKPKRTPSYVLSWSADFLHLWFLGNKSKICIKKHKTRVILHRQKLSTSSVGKGCEIAWKQIEQIGHEFLSLFICETPCLSWDTWTQKLDQEQKSFEILNRRRKMQ